MEWHKVRLVAKGFNQTQGIDYFETFSLVVQLSTIRMVLTFALTSHWTIRQLDIQKAFLNEDLQEQVYMHQPPDFINAQNLFYVCYLHKAIYGLKQAPKAWFHKPSNSLIYWGFQSSRTNSFLYFYHTKNEVPIILIYVDKILLISSLESQVFLFISHINNKFALRDLGALNYFLGIKFTHCSNFVHLS